MPGQTSVYVGQWLVLILKNEDSKNGKKGHVLSYRSKAPKRGGGCKNNYRKNVYFLSGGGGEGMYKNKTKMVRTFSKVEYEANCLSL